MVRWEAIIGTRFLVAPPFGYDVRAEIYKWSYGGLHDVFAQKSSVFVLQDLWGVEVEDCDERHKPWNPWIDHHLLEKFEVLFCFYPWMLNRGVDLITSS
jgi:hypothetical protein